MPRPYPPEFRRRAVELTREGIKPVGKLAKDLGISESCLRDRPPGRMPDGGASGRGSAQHCRLDLK